MEHSSAIPLRLYQMHAGIFYSTLAPQNGPSPERTPDCHAEPFPRRAIRMLHMRAVGPGKRFCTVGVLLRRRATGLRCWYVSHLLGRIRWVWWRGTLRKVLAVFPDCLCSRLVTCCCGPRWRLSTENSCLGFSTVGVRARLYSPFENTFWEPCLAQRLGLKHFQDITSVHGRKIHVYLIVT